MNELNYNPYCTNKNCIGGVIYNTGKVCKKCNPEYSKKIISTGAITVLSEAGIKDLLLQDACSNDYFLSVANYIDENFIIKRK